jgi:hypothetical protein
MILMILCDSHKIDDSHDFMGNHIKLMILMILCDSHKIEILFPYIT